MRPSQDSHFFQINNPIIFEFEIRDCGPVEPANSVLHKRVEILSSKSSAQSVR